MDNVTGSTNRLVRLKLSETNVPSPDRLLAELYRGDERVAHWHAALPDADTVARPVAYALHGNVPDPARRSLPTEWIDLFRGLAEHFAADEVLWIDLARPRGRLAVLPWERWLEPVVERAILRLPRLPFKPIRPDRGLHIAYCSSAAVAKGQFDVAAALIATCGALLHAIGDVTFHVFLDAGERERVREAALAHDLAPYLQFHVPPPSLSGAAGSAAESEDPLASPWLQWIAGALPSRGVDVVHWVSHGYLSRGRGAIALARHPRANDDHTSARFVYATDVIRLLDVSGASGVVLTSPHGNASVSGLLALADELISSRPGPVVFHDGELDESADVLARSMAFLYGGGPLPRSPAVAICAHPDRLQTASAEQQVSSEEAAPDWTQLYRTPVDAGASTSFDLYQKVIEKYTLAHRLRGQDVSSGTGSSEVRARGLTPDKSADADNWLYSCQRVLERHTAKLASAPLETSAAGKAVQKGAEEALLYVKDLLEDKGGKGGA